MFPKLKRNIDKTSEPNIQSDKTMGSEMKHWWKQKMMKLKTDIYFTSWCVAGACGDDEDTAAVFTCNEVGAC